MLNSLRFELGRRSLFAAACLSIAGALVACATPTAPLPPPVVFVHGNGDTAALWMPTLWRFESNGWPGSRLHALHLPLPSARDDDTVPQAGRSSTAEHAQYLAQEVDRVLSRTGAKQVVLVGNSRGGNAIRNYVQNFGGASKVSHAVLGGTPNHGVWADANNRPGSEFNGAGPFLTGLNAPKGAAGDEVTPGPRWMTLRSDNNDKFAQPDGVWIGQRGRPTQVSFDGPALKGATNLVLPARDHREVSFHPEAFARTFEFITGAAPKQMNILAQERPVLDGMVSGIGPGGPDNVPLPGASVEVYVVNAQTGERQGAAVHKRSVAADGRWGPFTADARHGYEFVVSAPGYATSHVYRSPFLRSSDLVHFRAARLATADKDAAAVVTFTRPRGYFGLPRDRITFDGQSPPGVPTGVAGISSSTLRLKDSGRAVVAQFDSGVVSERIVGRAWPAAENRLVVLEMHY
jgi:triacylglycerol lipase